MEMGSGRGELHSLTVRDVVWAGDSSRLDEKKWGDTSRTMGSTSTSFPFPPLTHVGRERQGNGTWGLRESCVFI